MKLKPVFLISMAIGAGGVIALNVRHVSERATLQGQTSARSPVFTGQKLATNIDVKSQIALLDVPRARTAGYRTIIDMRPDGEVDGQPASADVRDRSGPLGIHFVYIPTPHGQIPEEAVEALARTLAIAPGPILLYCRSGSRAARTWALAEASRLGGAPAPEIAAALRSTGHQIDDLLPDIERRIASRKAAI